MKSIGEYAFYGYRGLTSVTIGNNVTSIGGSAFYGCSGLTSVTIETDVLSIGKQAFFGCDNLAYNTYDNAEYLGNATNPYLVLVKATDTSLTHHQIYVHDWTKVIADYAFSSCQQLRYVQIGDNVTYIGSSAFDKCSGLSINFGGTKEEWNVIKKSQNWNSGWSGRVFCTDGNFSY